MSNEEKSLVLTSCITIFFLPLLLVSLDYPPEVSLLVACQQHSEVQTVSGKVTAGTHWYSLGGKVISHGLH